MAQGAILEVINASLHTVDVNQNWWGVEVWGMSDQYNGISRPQSKSAKAIFTNAVIMYANYAVSNIRHPYENYSFYLSRASGGIIQARNTTFMNNANGVLMKDQQHYTSNGKLAKDKSYFFDCNFDAYIQPKPVGHTGQASSSIYGIFAYLWGVEGVRFLGCDFHDDAHYMTAGIYGHNAGFTVNELCNTLFVPLGGPCGGGTPSTFYGLKRAVDAFCFKELHGVSVQNTTFTNNYDNIRLDSYVYPLVTHNTITFSGSSKPAGQYFTGINIIDCTGFKVEENSISATNYNGWTPPLSSTSQPAIGIIINDAGPNHNDVYLNYITNMDYALQGIGQNRTDPNTGRYTGLRFLCNDVNSSIDESYDIVSANYRILMYLL